MAIRLGTLTLALSAAEIGDNAPVRGIVRTVDSETEAYVKRLDDPRRALVEVCVQGSLAYPYAVPLIPGSKHRIDSRTIRVHKTSL